MALDADEIARRVRAARALAGLEQAELGRLMNADGYGVTDPGRLERPHAPDKKPPPLTPGRIASLAVHTGVPESWFTEPDIRRLFAVGVIAGDDPDEFAAEVNRRLEAAQSAARREREAVAKQISDLRTQLDALRADVPQVDPPPELSPEEDAQERDRLERELADRAGSEPADSDSQSAAGS